MVADKNNQLHLWLAGSCLVLMLATWRLWFPTPQTTFPAVPIHSALVRCPWWVDGMASLGCILGWLVVAGGRVRYGAALALVCGMLAVGLNQHRLQPWFYELQILALLILVAARDHLPELVRVLASSVYIYSAISKMDVSFFETLGPQMVSVFADALSLRDGGDRLSKGLVWAAPLFELGVGLCLLWARSRWIGAVMGIALHIGLIGILGPWGLGHSWGVLLWNVHFMGLLVWIACNGNPAGIELGGEPRGRRIVAWSLLTPFLVLPVTERWEIWDHWTSWAVYAPHNSRVQLLVDRREIGRMPEDLRGMMASTTDMGEFESEVPIGRWSLESLGVPVYPQSRFQVGVARSVAQRVSHDFAIRCIVWGAADRFTKRRHRVECPDRRAIERMGETFWLNTRPRDFVPTERGRDGG